MIAEAGAFCCCLKIILSRFNGLEISGIVKAALS